MLTSKTTQNVAIGAGGTAGTVLALLAIARQVAPQVVVWPEETDAQIVAVATTVIAPLVSRSVAFFRDPSKRKRNSRGFYGFLLPFTTPDGDEVVQLDVDTIWAAYQLYLAEKERIEAEEEADDAAEAAERASRLRELDTRLQALLRQLQAAR